jgi:hypothetical protein
MNCLRAFSISLMISALFFTSCTKTEIKTETITDTVQIAAKDTTFAMDVAGWDYFDFLTLALKPSGSSTFFNTQEGIKFFGQASRYGGRLQVKNEVGFKDKTLYFKWKGDGEGEFSAIAVSIKYDPMTNDSNPAIQGVDLEFYSMPNTYNGSTLILPNTWYYTRVAAVKGTDNYQVISATGNYDNKGGNVIRSKVIPIYTKHGYPAIRLGDPYAGQSAYAVLAECKIADN